MARFDDCVAFVLRMEGGYVDDPVDRGGVTNMGITQREYSQWLASVGNPPGASVRDITMGEVETIYRVDYWNKVEADRFGGPVDLVLFDTAVNHGVSRTIKILQDALQVPVDGVLGPMTLTAALVDSPRQLAIDVLTARANFYTRIVQNAPSQARYSNGWANRLDAVTREAGL